MELRTKTVKKILGIIAFTMFLYFAMKNYTVVLTVLSLSFTLLRPFLVGGVIAYVLYLPIRAMERRIFAKWDHPKHWALRRTVCLIITLVLIAALLAAITLLVLPQLKQTVAIIVDSAPSVAQDVIGWANGLTARFPQVNEFISSAMGVKINWQSVVDTVIDFLKHGLRGVFSSTVSVVSGVFTVIVNAVIALVFSIYLLYNTEKLSMQCKKILFSYFRETVAQRVLYICRLTEKTFAGFVFGQCTEALVICLMFMLVLGILRMPYVLLISTLIGVTALIPIVGAFVGCVVGALLILVQNPMQAVWFVVAFLIVQQVEGNLIYPRVVGSHIELPPIWILVAVTVGGGLMGVVGMLLFIPLSSVLYTLLKESTARRLAQRGITEAMLEAPPREKRKIGKKPEKT